MVRARALLLLTLVLACREPIPGEPTDTGKQADSSAAASHPLAPLPAAKGSGAYVQLVDHRLLRLDDGGWAQIWNTPLRQIVVAADGSLALIDDAGVHHLDADGLTTLLRWTEPVAGADEIDVGPDGAIWLLDHDEPGALMQVGADGTGWRWDPAQAGFEAHALLGMSIDGRGRPWLIQRRDHGLLTLASDRWIRVQGWSLAPGDAPVQDGGIAADGALYLLVGATLLRVGDGGIEARLALGPDDDESMTMAFDRRGAAVVVARERCRLRVVELPAMTLGPEHDLPGCEALALSAFDDRRRSWFIAADARAVVVTAEGARLEYTLPAAEIVDIDVLGPGPTLPSAGAVMIPPTATLAPAKPAATLRAATLRTPPIQPPPPPSFGPELPPLQVQAPIGASMRILADVEPPLLVDATLPRPERVRYRSRDHGGVDHEGIWISDGERWWQVRVVAEAMTTPRCDCADNLPTGDGQPLRWTRSRIQLRPVGPDGSDHEEGWRPLLADSGAPRCAVDLPRHDHWPLAVAGSRLFTVEHRQVQGCDPVPERRTTAWIHDLRQPLAQDQLLDRLAHELPGSVVDPARVQVATVLGVDAPHDLELLALIPIAGELALLYGVGRPREAGGVGGWDDLTLEAWVRVSLPPSSSLTPPPSLREALVAPAAAPWTGIGWSTIGPGRAPQHAAPVRK